MTSQGSAHGRFNRCSAVGLTPATSCYYCGGRNGQHAELCKKRKKGRQVGDEIALARLMSG